VATAPSLVHASLADVTARTVRIPDSVDAHWYWDVNRFAVHTAWAHGFMAFYAHFGGVGLLALVLLWAWWAARSRPEPARAVGTILWAAGGTVVAWLIAHFIMKPLIARPRPYFAMPKAEVLLHRTTGYSFPSGHATVAGAVILGLWLARDRVRAIIATVLGLFLAFARVYAGMHYPGDVAGGLVVGAIVMVLLWKPAVAALSRFDGLLLETPLAPLVAVTSWRRAHPVPSPAGSSASATAAGGTVASGGSSGDPLSSGPERSQAGAPPP